MKCPECKNTKTKKDCYDGVIYCTHCGLVLTATHYYVGGNKISLPYGFRPSLRQCETNDENDYSVKKL